MQDEPLGQSPLPLAEGFAGTGLAGDGIPHALPGAHSPGKWCIWLIGACREISAYRRSLAGTKMI